MRKFRSVFFVTLDALFVLAVVTTGVLMVADATGWRIPPAYTSNINTQLSESIIQPNVLAENGVRL